MTVTNAGRRTASMQTTEFGPRDLLEYNPAYRLLICRECKHAIQKNALRSHLLRHKIYRDDRKRLLSSISRLDLLNPEDVPLPAPDLPPIDSIPVLSGYRCTEGRCGHLAASTKRMKRHWTEAHGMGRAVPALLDFAVAVRLQTFFRGTQLRYHEVAGTPQDADVDAQVSGEVGERDTGGDEIASAKQLLHLKPERPKLESGPLDFDIETLTCFHHFITIIAPTLPCSGHPNVTLRYWQTQVISYALQHPWLLCGLLALSACHSAALATNDRTKRAHRAQQKQSSYAFSAGCIQAKTLSENEGTEIAAIAAQVKCLLHCAQWTLSESTPNDAADATIPLTFIMATIKGASPPALLLDHGPTQDELRIPSPSLTAVLRHLRALPNRMAEVLGRPKSIQDVLATLAAICALEESCAIGFSSDSITSAWQAITSWQAKVPEQFNQMSHRPEFEAGALVVLAHWLQIVVKRAEELGCWYLSGVVEKGMSVIRTELTARCPAALGLLDVSI